MTNFIMGVIAVLICVGSLITSSEHHYGRQDYAIVHWILGFAAGFGVTILTIAVLYL